jgi:hypothetical protein
LRALIFAHRMQSAIATHPAIVNIDKQINIFNGSAPSPGALKDTDEASEPMTRFHESGQNHP